MTKIVLAYDKSPKSLQEVQKDFESLLPLLPLIGMVKIGLEAMTTTIDIGGYPANVAALMRAKLREANVPVLWDQKLHDIGNTMAAVTRNLSLGVEGITVHAAASLSGLISVVTARNEMVPDTKLRPALFGVTVLTDITPNECDALFSRSSESAVCMFAEKLVRAGFDGIVCSGNELAILARKGYTNELQTLVPGIRPAWAAVGDQKRVMTPKEASELGATYVVIGRPILGHSSPLEATTLINNEFA